MTTTPTSTSSSTDDATADQAASGDSDSVGVDGGPHDAVVRFAVHGRVLEATIDRPASLNALNGAVLAELVDRVEAAAADPSIGCVVITGSERAFAAGADIGELARQTYLSMSETDYFSRWDDFARLRIPKVAAVSGYALGGGCELAMMCDIVVAAENARFGQPEIKLGLIPGMGGTQRLARRVGRAKATDLILTGRMMAADEAERCGLVARVVPTDELRATALEIATSIAGFSDHTVRVALEAIDRSDQSGLDDGLLFERRSYYALFDTPDAREGMTAFLEKRDPRFGHR